MKTIIYLVECYDYTEETTHYVSSAWKNREDAIKGAKQTLDDYVKQGYKLHESSNENCIGWVQNEEESKFYWINEVELS